MFMSEEYRERIVNKVSGRREMCCMSRSIRL